MSEKIGEIFVEMGIDGSRLASDLQQKTSQIKQSVKSLEATTTKLKLNFDNALAKMKITEVQALHARLRAEMQRKIAMNANVSSIELTRTKLASVERALTGIKTESVDASSTTTRGFNSIKASALVLIGTITALSAAFRKWFRDAMTQARAEAGVEQAVLRTGYAAGYTADQLFALASGLQQITGAGDEAILSGVTKQLLTFTQITEDNFRRAQEAVLDLNAVIADGNTGALTSQAIQLGKALENPIQGVGALSRAGVTFTAEQKKMIQTLISQNNLFEAQKVILDEIEAKYGGQAKALADASKGTKQFSAAWGDLGEKFGQFLTDAPGLTWLVKEMTKGFENWTKLFQGAAYYARQLKVELDNLRQTSSNITMNSLRTSTAQAREDLLAFNREQLNANRSQITMYEALIAQEQSSVRLNNSKIDSYNTQISNLQKLIAIQEGEIVAINKYNNKIKELNSEWSAQDKTVGQIKDRIQELTESLDNYSTDDPLLQSTINQIKELQKLLPSISEEKKKEIDLIQQTIDKQKINIELHQLQFTVTKEILESAKSNLETLLLTVTKEEDRVKLLRQIKELTSQIASMDLEIFDIDDSEFDKTTKDAEQTAIEWANKRMEMSKSAEDTLARLRISNIENEFEQRRIEIETEAAKLLEMYSEVEGQRLGLSEEFANARMEIEKNKQLELRRLEQQKYAAALSAVQTIGNNLQRAFDSAGTSLISKLNEALSIAIAIAETIKAINILSSLFGNVGGAFEAIPAATGGRFSMLGSSVTKQAYNNIPKFAGGGKFTVPPGFENDSFLMRVQSREVVSVTPKHAVGNTDGLLAQINSAIQAMTLTLIRKDLSVNIENRSPETEVVVKRLKKIERRLSDAGVNFNER